MPTLDTYRKQAKLLMRWHQEGNYSIGEKLRLLPRFRTVTDREALDMALPLVLAQEIVAAEAGHASWAALKAAAANAPKSPRPDGGPPELRSATPILFVRDVRAASEWYAEKLGFDVDFLHGHPAFYGSVSRDNACLHLRFVHAPNFAALATEEGGLIVATIQVTNVKALYAEIQESGAEIAQPLARQAWGGTDFHVRDPDGNVISFVTYG
jgi:uncharacterized glyoxalase superfamily protein PhnB